MNLNQLKPIVSRPWLFMLAGLMWTGVGLMLLWRAIGWLAAAPHMWLIVVASTGIALFSYRFMFTHTARKNILRLCALPARVSLFAFNSLQGYAIIVLMIALGITLRHSAIDRGILAVVYTAMGGALLLASLHFYVQFWRVQTQAPPGTDE
ncbi:MAG: hypothetical protein GXP37_07180 [Chloroflexi bacterium]|nr:hypothetical protein [Chloroflexota bacterium]